MQEVGYLHSSNDAAGAGIVGLFDAVPDALVATDIDGVIVRANAAAGELFARRPSDLLGASMEDLLPEESKARYRLHRQAFVAQGTKMGPELEGLALTVEGREIVIDATIGRLDTAGSPILLLSIREVSDRVRTQRDLERRLVVEGLAAGISRRLNTSTHAEIDSAVEGALGELGRFSGADRTHIVQFSADGTTMTRTHDWCSEALSVRAIERRIEPTAGLPWLIGGIRGGNVVQVPSLESLPPDARAEQVHYLERDVCSFGAVPMLVGGEAIGFIGFESTSQPLSWRSDEMPPLLVLQDFFVNALRRRQVAGELQRANRMLQAVSECNDALIRARDEDTLLEDVCRIVVEAGGYVMSWVGVAVDGPGKPIEPITSWGDDRRYVESLSLTWADTERGRGPAGVTIRTRAPVVVQSVATEAGFPESSRASALACGFASAIAVPFDYGDGVAGVLSVYAAEEAAFDAPEVETLTRFADELAFGIEALRTRQRQRQAEQQLRDMLRSKEEFIATIAHELRTPLTAVVGFAQLLHDGGAEMDPGDRAGMVNMVVDQGQDLANIVDDLLVVAKAEAGTLSVAAVGVDLSAQAAQVLESCGLDPAQRLEMIGPRRRALGDPSRVRQIVRNLVTNAIRYGGSGIRVVVACEENVAQVSVHDDGPGVPVEDQEAIFEPYRRAHNAPGLTASLGLGLTISRQLARLMEGDLTYRRDHGESVFTLTLPTSA